MYPPYPPSKDDVVRGGRGKMIEKKMRKKEAIQARDSFPLPLPQCRKRQK